MSTITPAPGTSAPDSSPLPIPRLPDPDGVPALRWAVLGPAGIAGAFVDTVQARTRQRVVAVGSRSAARSAQFAAEHGIERAYDNYEATVADPEVDVVYIATPPSHHLGPALLAIAAGKHVLVEKPFTLTGAEAVTLAAAAQAAGVLAMEAMWARYLPQADVIRQLLGDGALGEIQTLFADHGQRLIEVPRLMQPELGGGALLDLGVYPVSFASSILGTPSATSVTGALTETGVDAHATLVLGYASGAEAILNTHLLARTPTTAAICGTAGMIELYTPPFFGPGSFRLRLSSRGVPATEWSDSSGITGHQGLCYQATALASYVGEGRTESPLHSLDETTAIMNTLDEARHQLGAYWPGERVGEDS
jgi:predicted dehydrogenase